MCGITAAFSPKSQLTEQLLKSGTQPLKHRGPDLQSVWVSPCRKVGLGHARLSIIDLSETGNQPLANEDGRIQLVHNGEFYGFEAHRRALTTQGHRFRGHSDSEILIHLYEESGTRCLQRLRGEFAFALWDDRNQTLFAARDRFGIKPLFYAWHRETLYLASEIKSLLAMGVPSEWDMESVFQMHSSLLIEPSRTYFNGVYQLPPGHYLLATPRSFQILRYWDFDYPHEGTSSENESELIERFKEKFEESVRIRLRADVPVGCYLSGGLDSCSVLGVAQAFSNQKLHAFTLSFDKAEYDESAIAREMAEKAQSHFYPIEVNEADLAENFSAAVWHAETQFLNPHGIAKFLLSKFVKEQGYKVVLTGEGSDEIFGGYVHFKKDMLLQHSPGLSQDKLQEKLNHLRETNQVSAGMLWGDGDPQRLESVRKFLGYVPAFFEVNAQNGSYLLPLLSSEVLREFHDRDPFRVFLNSLPWQNQLSLRAPVNQSLYLWSKTCLPNYILSVLGDRMEMSHSIEGRVPFLDHELVELVVKLPLRLKIRDLVEKYVLREAARPYITETVYRRQKHPFLAPPPTQRGEGPLYELIQDTLRGEKLRAVPFYNQREVIKLLDKMPTLPATDRAGLDVALMILTSLSLLRSVFKIGETPSNTEGSPRLF